MNFKKVIKLIDQLIKLNRPEERRWKRREEGGKEKEKFDRVIYEE